MSNLVNNRMAATQSINRLIEKSNNSHRGFTVLELLVASLLLGMLMTILTMIFNQSSIAWRTGMAGVANLDDVREKISAVRYKADNAYVWRKKDESFQTLCIHSVFDDQTGELLENRNDYIDEDFGLEYSPFDIKSVDEIEGSQGSSKSLKGDASPRANYVVNVMSAGPDGKMDTYDDIWSFPDDPNEW